jgi:hypothetical protein
MFANMSRMSENVNLISPSGLFGAAEFEMNTQSYIGKGGIISND